MGGLGRRCCVVVFFLCWFAHAQIQVFSEPNFQGTSSTLANGTFVNDFQGQIGSLRSNSLALHVYSKPNLNGNVTVVAHDMFDLTSLAVGSISVTQVNWSFAVVSLFVNPQQSWLKLSGPFVQYTPGDTVDDFQGRIGYFYTSRMRSRAILVCFTGVNFTGTRTFFYDSKAVSSIVRSFQVVAYNESWRAVEIYQHTSRENPVAQLLAGESIAHWNGPTLELIDVPRHLVAVFYSGHSFTGNKTFAFSSRMLNYTTLQIGSIEVVLYNASMDMVEIFPLPNFNGPPLQFKAGDAVSTFKGSIGSIIILPLHAMVVYQGNQFTGSSVQLTQNKMQEFTTYKLFQVQSFQIQSIPMPPAVHLFTSSQCSGLPTKTLYLHDKEPTVNESFHCLHVHHEFALVMYSRPNYQGNRSFVWSAWRDMPPAIWETMASFVVIEKANVASFVRDDASSPDAIVWASGIYSPSVLKICAYDAISVGDNRSNIVGLSTPNRFPSVDYVDIPPGVSVQAFCRPNFKGSFRILTVSGTYPFVRSFRVYRTDDALPTTDDESVVAFLKHGRSDYSLLVPARETSASQIVFAMTLGASGFDTVDVPASLALVTYSGSQFQGQRRIIPSGIYTAEEQGVDFLYSMQSFRVIQASDVALLPIESTGLRGVRGHFTSKACTEANMTFVLDQEYMVLPKLDWSVLYIPDGLALVAYDRPWLLGRYVVWTSPVVKSPRSLGAKIRSVKVVLASEAPLPQLDPLPPSVFGGPFGRIYVDEEEPGISRWEKAWLPDACSNGVSLMTLWISRSFDGYWMTLYNDYNFQESKTVIDGTHLKREYFYTEYKSFKLHRANNCPVTPTEFAGIYPNLFGLDVPPILMQIGDNISALVFPWNAPIQKVTVPNGLKILAYAREQFQGDCTTWVKDSVLNEPNILSLRVRTVDDVSMPCEETFDQSKSTNTLQDDLTNHDLESSVSNF
ncbi:Aste57867_18071 [Aphanomyces stellatus]|uniref:Aste57867_18071 protein n=1 Tax=Aphanomyces stellatus TaxID=120398 RepID=A0A485L933_9STRA|nr:hypothetical protein As57867_018009 [Aphanomyces stellatus]VFT94810.1 Aste57867_18071 [Aphanomyces stellatus]